MATAPREDQLQLLKVAELDATLARLRRDDAKHPLRAEVGELMNLVAGKARELASARERLEENQAALDSASSKSSELATVIGDKEARLNAGTGMDSRELLTLQSEINTQRTMLDEASEAEFAALEAVENSEAEIERLESEQRLLNEKIVSGRAELEDAVEVIQREISDIERERTGMYDPLADELKRVYERARDRGGLAVLAMYPNGSTSGGIEFSPIEVAQIRNADPDEIYLSEDYGCIVVRVDS